MQATVKKWWYRFLQDENNRSSSMQSSPHSIRMGKPSMVSRYDALLILLICSLVNNSVSASFLGSNNPASRHQLDWCQSTDGMGVKVSFSKPIDMQIVDTDACNRFAAAHGVFVAKCDIGLIADTPNQTDASFPNNSVLTNIAGNIVDSGPRHLVTCGCYDSVTTDHIGVGTDPACYCKVGYDWDATTSACIAIKYFTKTIPPSRPQCNSCDANSVGHPINPASGAVFDTFNDDTLTTTASPFKRFYNSTAISNTDVSNGWRHSYSRNVIVKYSTIDIQQYLQSPDYSSQYADPVTACTNGFPQIQSRVLTWTDVTASYVSGNCVLSKNGVSIGTIPIYATGNNLAPSPQPVAYDVIRDDSQLIRFIVNSGSIVAPPGISLKLQQTSTGFTVTDNSDNIEQYDSNGRLLNVTSRSGVVQTMNYDGSGRLSGVVDSFGHQLTLSYDAQGHLNGVTR